MATVQERHPELFAEDKMIDPRTRKRVVPMEVMAMGMSRTGTASMQAALEILGYNPCFHGFSVFYNIRDVEMWREAVTAKFLPAESPLPPFTVREFDQLLGNFRALCDMPAVCFAEELVSAYPDAKVILVERDIENWYRSFDQAVIQQLYNPISNAISALDRHYLWRLNQMSKTVMRGMFRSPSKRELQDNARAVYVEHYALVRRVTPKENLLEFRLEEGWEPLCRFLGREVPTVPFPRINDAKALDEKVTIVVGKVAVRMLGNAMVVVGGLGAAVLGVWWYWR